MKHYHYLYIDTLSDVTFLSYVDYAKGYRTISNDTFSITYCIFMQQSKNVQNFIECLLKTFICIEVEL